jgi:hypothetical protein
MSFGPSAVATQQQTKLFGVMEDGPYMGLAANTGFNVVKKTIWLAPTNQHLTDLNPGYRIQIDRDMAEAKLHGISVILELYPQTVFAPPRRPAQQRGLCDVGVDLVRRYPEVLGVEVGIEPNNHAFWRQQFAGGRNVSSAAYTNWLGTCYDRLKAIKPDLIVIGGSLASSGQDDPTNPKSDTSPTLFIQKMCESNVQSGRDRPLMDWFDMHSYQEASPDTIHAGTTITIADYPKLDDQLACFTRPGQLRPLILWGESGYETAITAAQQYRYTKQQPQSAATSDEFAQGKNIGDEIRLAYCQPHTVGFLNFHLVDEFDLGGWQSGLYYAEDSPLLESFPALQQKASRPIVRRALEAARQGNLTCGQPLRVR